MNIYLISGLVGVVLIMLFENTIFTILSFGIKLLYKRFWKKIQSESEEIHSNSTLVDESENPVELIAVGRSEMAAIDENDSIRVLTLENEQHQDATIYKLEIGWYLEFHLGPSLFGRKVTIYVNLPTDGNQFSRTAYQKLSWLNPLATDDSLIACIKMTTPGCFHYYIQCDEQLQKCGSGYFLVDPVLRCGSEVVPLSCIQCVTYLSKNLGAFSEWEQRLQVAKECGYNAVHFTPIQELGGSQSGYSLADQLKINPNFCDQHKADVTINDIIELKNKLRTEWKMLTIADIVLNHTANESEWLREHPECAYNMVNCPYLIPAYLLDVTLHNFSLEISKGIWEMQGIPPVVNKEEHLGAMRFALFEKILPKMKLDELFIVPVENLVSEFLSKCRTLPPPSTSTTPKNSSILPDLEIKQDPSFRRLKSTVDMELALKHYNIFRNDCYDEETRILKCASDFKARLELLNLDKKNELCNHLTAGVDNSLAGVRYFRVQEEGPQIQEISIHSPLFTRYFTDYNNEALDNHAFTQDGRFIMAHNGWVMNSEPLKNFADANSKVYLRRELIAWGDSVKLRYGNSPADCPHLWSRMKQYTEETVRAFDGVRLDNCHSTPIHVAEYLLDAARLIRPNLYVVAELFTNSDHTDNLFVNRLGITSLIRESMAAWDSHELGRLVYRYGGDPIGAFIKSVSRPLTPSVAHALFLDQTHDNPSPIEKRSVFDLLPSAALVSMACCATGSNMGYDLLVPHHIHVVDETRSYMKWGVHVTEKSGIVAGKKALNDLHYFLGKNGYNQVFVDQVDPDIVCVTRHNDVTHETVILISYTAFVYPNPFATGEGKGVTVTGCVERALIEAYVQHKSGDRYSRDAAFVKDTTFINGLSNYELVIETDFSPQNVSMVNLVCVDENTTRVNFTSQFKPGSVVALKFKQNGEVQAALHLSQIPNLEELKKSLTLADLNKILYCCDAEDGGVYNVPNFAPFVYCGLQGILSFMETIAFSNDLGHPICQHLREGDWLMNYTADRLKSKSGTKALGEKLAETFEQIKKIPRYLIPCYFFNVISRVHREMVYVALSLMSSSIKNGPNFGKSLALGSVQFGGIIDSSPLPPLSPNLKLPVPPVADSTRTPLCVSLSAGLPHFAVGYTRNWGRDTFIALRGLLLLTGRFDEARYIILAYGGCLRHGLIPNLLDGGRNARYNCRDAVWWWLYSIKNYVLDAPNGTNLLNDTVNRLYPTDDSPMSSVDQPLFDVIQEALTVHFQGLCFRERNAGRAIDAHMIGPGFDNQIGVHPATGFVFGGNEWNCGTWMDKMGSSEKAANRGKPATPRDGSAVEIVALSEAVISWLADMHKKGLYPYDGVSRENKDGTTIHWTFQEWAEKIQANFEKHFWIPSKPSPAELRPDLVHRRGIYKDSDGASQQWADYQMRCNYSVAMAVAPELFSVENAVVALDNVKTILLGPLGMKTLDPEDWAYNGYYDNSDDSTNAQTAHGFNYHQGPEWLWTVGYYLRSRLHFYKKMGDQAKLKEILAESKSYLANHYIHLQKSDWKGLPELTNKDATFCPFSCPTQAWSMASILEAVDDISQAEQFI